MADGDQHGEKLAALEKAFLDESANPVDLPNFSENQIIGRDGFGAIYKEVLPSGGTVAVKKLFQSFDMDKNFESEVACHMGVKHKNTVRFLGHCSNTQHMMVTYEGKLVCAEEWERLLCCPKGALLTISLMHLVDLSGPHVIK